MDNILKDDRFAHIVKDPKYRRIPKNERKVKIDKRFQSMFTDKKFAVSFKVDKRGRPYVKNSAENLRKYYDISEDEDEASSEFDEENLKEEEEEEEEKHPKVESKKEKVKKTDNKLPGLKNNEKGKLSNNIKQKLKNLSVNYARGEGELLSSSSEEDESTVDSEEENEICHDWGEFDKDAEEAVESTRRLAACNMDWDKIRAVDLMVSLNSFLPPGGIILSVAIYPSDYGLQRMKEEDVKGPTELVNNCSDESDIEEGSSYQMEKLRQYQLNRLKYYYAVIECDSPGTADKLWSECKNVEYESSGLKFDLRFIPDDMEFDQAPKEVCEKLPDFSTYQPRTFTTTALQQEKVDLTWDETNEERKELTMKINSGKLNELNDNHLKYLLASGSSEDESDENLESKEPEVGVEIKNTKGSTIDKYKQLLKSIDAKEKEKHKNDVQLECTWGYNAEERSKEFEKEKLQKSENRTPFEEYLDKRKEKRKAKRKAKMDENTNEDSDDASEDQVPSDIDMNDPYFAEELKNCSKKSKKLKNDKTLLNDNKDDEKDELELLLMDTNEIDNRKHFDMKEIEETNSMSKSKRKRLERKKKKKNLTNNDDDFEMNLNDERFKALYTSHHFNIDPADNHYRKTKGTEILISEQLKRRNKNKN